MKFFVWIFREIGAVAKARAQDLWRGLLRLLFGSWKRIGITGVVLLVILAAHNPQSFEPILHLIIGIGIMILGLKVMVQGVFGGKKKGKK